MFTLPTESKYIKAPLSLLVIMFVLHLTEPASIEWFGFYPGLILEGDWWRLMTGQFLHTNTNHLLLNAGGVILVWALHGEYYEFRHYWLFVISSSIVIGASLLLFAEYGYYAGLSGVLHGLFAYGGILDILKNEKTGWLLLTGLALKVGYELLVGPSADTEALIGAAVASEAHLMGLIAGTLLALPTIYKKTKRH